MKTETLLFELGCEELPTFSLEPLATALLANTLNLLGQAKIAYGASRWFATPRRLAFLIEKVALCQEDFLVERRGPALDRAFDEQGSPTKAATGFAASCGVSFDSLERQETDKGCWLYFRQEKKGEATKNLIPNILADAVKKLAIAKPMHWANNKGPFARPIHWLLVLLGRKVVDLELFTVKSGDNSCGHRFFTAQMFYSKKCG